MHLFSLLRPVAVLLVAAGIVTLTTSASAKERQHFSRGTALLDQTGNFVGSGYATHLGRYTEIGHVSISGENPYALDLDGWATYIAANGDEVYANVTGQLNFFTGAIIATVTYDGGSGRFDGASGSAGLLGQLGPDGISVVVVGTIDY